MHTNRTTAAYNFAFVFTPPCTILISYCGLPRSRPDFLRPSDSGGQVEAKSNKVKPKSCHRHRNVNIFVASVSVTESFLIPATIWIEPCKTLNTKSDGLGNASASVFVIARTHTRDPLPQPMDPMRTKVEQDLNL